MKKEFLKIAKQHGYLLTEYKRSRSDMGMVCYEFDCNNGAFKFTHYAFYPFGAAKYGVKQKLLDAFADRLKSSNPKLY